MRKYVVLIALAMLCVSAFAQMELMQNVFENTDFEPVYKEGAWAEYRLTNRDDKVSTLKFSVLEGNIEDDEPFVFEMKMTDEEGMWTITQFSGADPLDRETYSYMITQRKGDKARKMNVGELSKAMKNAQNTEPKEEGEETPDDLTIETAEYVEIEVPGGKFNTTQVTISNEEMTSKIWFSERVGPFGMVKAEQIGESKAELIAYGDDAESEIQGEVEEIELPNLQELMKSKSAQ